MAFRSRATASPCVYNKPKSDQVAQLSTVHIVRHGFESIICHLLALRLPHQLDYALNPAVRATEVGTQIG